MSVTPIVTSGAAIGRNSSTLRNPRALKRWRIMANATMVPSAVAPIVAMTAMTSESLIDEHMSELAHGCCQALVENLFQMKLYLFSGWLNENNSMTAFGATKKTKMRIATNSRMCDLIQSRALVIRAG